MLRIKRLLTTSIIFCLVYYLGFRQGQDSAAATPQTWVIEW